MRAEAEIGVALFLFRWSGDNRSGTSVTLAHLMMFFSAANEEPPRKSMATWLWQALVGNKLFNI